jgi:Ca2+:H+ antiporter
LDHLKSYGATHSSATGELIKASTTHDILGRICFWLALVTVIAPLMLFVCIICWGLIIAIPMAKLNWALIKYLFQHPTRIRFCSAPSIVFLSPAGNSPGVAGENGGTSTPMRVKPRLSAGQDAPSGEPSSKVLLCIYRAMGWQFYKYTIGGINIFFINLLPVVFFVIFDGWFLAPMVEERERTGQAIPAILAILASRLLIFLLSLLSVIPAFILYRHGGRFHLCAVVNRNGCGHKRNFRFHRRDLAVCVCTDRGQRSSC